MNRILVVFLGVVFLCHAQETREIDLIKNDIPHYDEVIEKEIYLYLEAKTNDLYFELFYAIDADTTMHFLRKILLSEKKILVRRNQFPKNDSVFYIAVRTVEKDGSKSKLYKRTQPEAYESGWFLLWKDN